VTPGVCNTLFGAPEDHVHLKTQIERLRRRISIVAA
jgi:hypothetical protein